jgi:hypothetical protein
MKYVVVGQNRETGARMSLEFEAESKAAAERKATHAGMSVRHVTDVTDGHPATATEPREFRPVRRRSGGVGGLVRVILFLAILAAAAWFLWPRIQPMLGR